MIIVWKSLIILYPYMHILYINHFEYFSLKDLMRKGNGYGLIK